MIKQWGKNPEYTFYIFTNWNKWSLPFSIWWGLYDATIGTCFSVTVNFLCFGFEIEKWRYYNA